MESRGAISIRFDTIDQLAKSCPPSPFRKRRLRKETKKFLVERATAAFTDEAGNVIETHEHAGDFKEW